MALNFEMQTTCNIEIDPIHDGGDKRPEPPTTTKSDGDGTEALVYKKGAWSKEEDEKLKRAVAKYGLRNWVTVEKFSGLARPAKNCRLRWLNYLRPNLKKCPITQEEERLILHLHSEYGNSWSRIASKLPGRSDNEIKNFWHKRAKKCQKHKLPIYPTSTEKQQSYANFTNSNIENHYNNADGDEHEKDVVKTACHTTDVSSAPSIHSPQRLISTPPSLSSPSRLVTSQKQSPTTDQTFLLPNAPTSQTLEMSQSTETPLLISDTASHIHQCQDSNAFTMLRSPPILSSHQGPLMRFSRATSKISSRGHFIPGQELPVADASAFLPPDSSVHMQWYYLQSPTTDPLSPHKLHLSTPVPSESCFYSSISIPDSAVQLNSSIASVPLSSPQLEQSSSSLDLQHIQLMTVDTDHVVDEDSSLALENQSLSIQFYHPATPGANSCAHEVEYDSNMDIMDELREAQARVRFLKKKLRQRGISKKREENFFSASPETTDLSRTEVPLDTNPSSGKKDMLKRTLKRKDDTSEISKTLASQVKCYRKDNSVCKLQKGENSGSGKYMEGIVESEMVARGENEETKSLSAEILQRGEDSLGEIFKRENSTTFQEQGHSIHLFDHINNQMTVKAPNSNSWDSKLSLIQGCVDKCLNECFSIEDLFSESSNLLQDSFFKGDLFGQRYEIEEPLSQPRQEPLADTFGPVYGQSTAMTLVKPGDEDCQVRYLQGEFGYRLGRVSDGLERKPTEVGYLGVQPIFCEPNLLVKYPEQNLLDLSLVENLWTEWQLVSQNQTFSRQTLDSAVNPMESNNWNDESGCSHTGLFSLMQGHEQDDINVIMPEDLSSLLEFLPTTNQTLEL